MTDENFFVEDCGDARGAGRGWRGCGTGPVVDIGGKHPNLRDAQQHLVSAYGKIIDAEHDRNETLGGHGARAKQLIMEADEELRAAANVANETHR